MASVQAWEDEIAKLSIDDANKYVEAFITILGWPMFKAEYGWTGIGSLAALVMSGKIRKQAVVTAESEGQR